MMLLDRRAARPPRLATWPPRRGRPASAPSRSRGEPPSGRAGRARQGRAGPPRGRHRARTHRTSVRWSLGSRGKGGNDPVAGARRIALVVTRRWRPTGRRRWALSPDTSGRRRRRFVRRGRHLGGCIVQHRPRRADVDPVHQRRGVGEFCHAPGSVARIAESPCDRYQGGYDVGWRDPDAGVGRLRRGSRGAPSASTIIAAGRPQPSPCVAAINGPEGASNKP